MKAPFWMFFISIVFTTTNEQCPLNVENISVTSCAGSTKYGPFIYIDFAKIKRPCTCIVIPLFYGKLRAISRGVNIEGCNTQVKVANNFIFGCTTIALSSVKIDVQINQPVDVRAEYSPLSLQGPFYHCIGFQQDGAFYGNLSVICGSTVSPTTIFRTTSSSTQLSHASSPIASLIESTSVVNTNEDTDVNLSSNTINVSYDSLLIESRKDEPEMLYIIAGSAGGGAIILVGLVVLILVLIKRTRRGRNKNGSTESDMPHKNDVFDNNPELPDNPLYLSSQPFDELGYSSDQEKQLVLPPMDSKTKKKMSSNYDVPPNNKPIDHGASSMPVYAVPKRGKDCTPEVNTADVYAEVCKPNRSTAQVPV